MNRFRTALALLVLGAATAAAVVVPSLVQARPRPRPSFTVKRGAYQSVARFRVSYSGTGRYATRYHSRPPNPGGKPDTDDARDSGTQTWSIRYRGKVTIPTCLPASSDPCQAISGLSGARGHTVVTGRIWHVHKDGLFTDQNRSARCRVRASTSKSQALPATIGVTYQPQAQTISVTSYDPVTDALVLLPTACPSQGDSIDGLYDNYLGPGFSFNSAYSADRWFTSSSVTIPIATLHRATRVRIPVRLTRTGMPPRHCDVPDPSYERCTTGGSWAGTITLTRT